MRLVSVCVVCVLLVVGCRSSLGAEAGTLDTMEEELTEHRELIGDLLEASLGEYDLVGSHVDVYPCELYEEWKAATSVVARPAAGTMEEGVRAIADELESRGTTVETVDFTHIVPLVPAYTVDTDEFTGTLDFWWSDEPETGIQVTINGGCYSASEIGAEDPYSLVSDVGIDDLRFRLSDQDETVGPADGN